MRNIHFLIAALIACPCAFALASDKVAPTLKPEFEVDVRGTLLAPESVGASADDYFLVHAGTRVRVLSVRDGKPLGATTTEFDNPPSWIKGDDKSFVLATPFAITGHRLEGEPLTWSIAQSDRQGHQDPEDNNPIRQIVSTGDQLVAMFDDGTVMRLQVADDAPVWQQTLGPKPAGGLVIVEDAMTYLTRTNRGESIHILDARTGEQRSVYDVPNGDSVLDQFPGESITMLRVPDGFIGVGSQTGQQQWRIGGHSRLPEGHAAADASGIYASVDGQQVVKFSRETGERLWRFEGVGVKPPARVTLSVCDRFLLVRGESFVQVIDATNGASLGRIECLNREQIASTKFVGNVLRVLVKPARKESIWRLEELRSLQKGATESKDAHYFLQPFANFKNAIMLGDALIIHDGDRLIGFDLSSN
ncbi:MAG TPA: PQQ-binding-like beta-propeller repeat protein [Phycisphaerae bacterium]|nr:PQQ-binding-like beta-propeller repeat protein [Phycisphaerae bacterium]